MSKLLATLIAAIFAGAVSAQSADPKPKEGQVSRQTARIGASAKNKGIKDADIRMTSPDNSASSSATAAMQKDTTAASKRQPRQRPNLSTPEARSALQKAATQ